MKKKITTKRIKCPGCSGYGWKMMSNCDGTKACELCHGKKTLSPKFAKLVKIRDSAQEIIDSTRVQDR